jgi:hypothetical protein
MRISNEPILLAESSFEHPLNFTRMSNFTVIGKLIEQKYHLESKKITNYEF